MTLVAWTAIKSADKDGKTILVQPGEEVSAGKLNLSDEDFDQLILARAVRDREFPLPDDYPYSLRTWYTRQIADAQKDQEKALELALSMTRDIASKPPPMALPDGVEVGGTPSEESVAPGTEPEPGTDPTPTPVPIAPVQ